MDKRVVKSAQYNKRRAYPNNCNFTAISSKTTASKLSLRQNLTLYMSKFRQNDTQNRIYRSFLTIIGRYSWLGFWLNNIMFYLQLKMVKFLDGICTMHYWCWNGRFKKSQTSFFCLFFRESSLKEAISAQLVEEFLQFESFFQATTKD